MHISRRNFLGGLGAAGAMGLTGCKCPFCCCGPKGKIALQLYSIHRYIGGIKNKDGKVVTPGVGLERALADVAKIGYKAVEFAGYYGFTGNQLKFIHLLHDDEDLLAHLLCQQSQFDEVLVLVTVANDERVAVHVSGQHSMEFGLRTGFQS